MPRSTRQSTVSVAIDNDQLQDESIHVKSWKTFQCKIDSCRKKFSSKGNLQMHTLTHFTEKPFKCSLCFKTFAQKSNLEIHVLRHANKFNNICRICSKEFVTEVALQAHFVTHTNQSRFKCHVCKYAAPSNSALQDHIRSHTKEKPFNCSLCTKSFTKSGSLTTHLRLHGQRKQLKCSFCEFRAHWPSSLKQHMSFHENKVERNSRAVSLKQEILLCTKTSPSQLVIKSDKHGPKSNIQVNSDTRKLIPKSYFLLVDNDTVQSRIVIDTKSDLSSIKVIDDKLKIKNIHQSIVPFSTDEEDVKGHRMNLITCPFPSCRLEFSTENEFADHVTIHTNEKPWNCDSCGKWFRTKSDLVTHQQALDDYRLLVEHCNF